MKSTGSDVELIKSSSFSGVFDRHASYDSTSHGDESDQLSSLLHDNDYPAIYNRRYKTGSHRRNVAIATAFVLGIVALTMMSTFSEIQTDNGLSPVKSLNKRVVDLSQYAFSDKSPTDITFPLNPGRALSSRPQVATSFSSDTTADSSLPKTQTVIRQDGRKRDPTYPTNAWYENLILFDPNQGYTPSNKVYSLPYIIDTAGPVPGLRLNLPFTVANSQVIQMTQDDNFGVTMAGIGWNEASNNGHNDVTLSSMYGGKMNYVLGEEAGELGVVLKYGEDDNKSMIAPIVRGMPYGTMIYKKSIKPSIFSNGLLRSPPTIDESSVKIVCSDPSSSTTTNTNSVRVQREVKLHFDQSDFTWLVFFSRPVDVYCLEDSSTNQFQLIAEDTSTSEVDVPLVVRLTLWNSCTSGGYSTFCQNQSSDDVIEEKATLLRKYADVYPYSPTVHYLFERFDSLNAMDAPEEVDSAVMEFNWDARNMKTGKVVSRSDSDHDLLVYALDHHLQEMKKSADSAGALRSDICEGTLHGQVCLLIPNVNTTSTVWSMQQDLTAVSNLASSSFTAPRPPHYSAIPSLAEAVASDIKYKIPDNYMIGAGDTYFSGKMLAKLGRIIVIARELRDLCTGDANSMYDVEIDMQNTKKACKAAEKNLPSEEDITEAIDQLRSGVEIWLNGNAEAIFVYDGEWGGLVNCGCNYDYGHCDNVFPNCPALGDPGANFGQGFYNDHHFHQGYHVYAAAILSSFDPSWGRQYFENVITLIRDFANPSRQDSFFTTFRHKDWYLGSSWASGIATLGGNPYPNGRNQESSSEAVAAYEAIGMYGSIMLDVWKKDDAKDPLRNDNIERARNIRDIGRLLTATEVRAADRFWHVTRDKSGSNSIYPDEYSPSAVGMLWNTMAQFQTWFGNLPFFVYGIQLLPVTPISEDLYDFEWITQLYPDFSSTCESNTVCEEQGWSILQYTALAVLGQRELALEKALLLPEDAFLSAGGNGHSLSNTIWFIATRPDPSIVQSDTDNSEPTNDVTTSAEDSDDQNPCGPCSKEVCAANLCPWGAPFRCVKGAAMGGCSASPWNLGATTCKTCCDISSCEQYDQDDDDDDSVEENTNVEDSSDKQSAVSLQDNSEDNICPPCSKESCAASQCGIAAPYRCESGPAVGGCGTAPWVLAANVCNSCCDISNC